jgi:predicted permease
LRWRHLLVGLEISLSVVLLIQAGLLLSTFLKIGSEPLGFETRDVLVTEVALPRTAYRTVDDEIRFSKSLLQRLGESPGIRAAGAAPTWPFNVDGLGPLETERRQGMPLEQLPQVATFEVSPGYFAALGIPLLRGRAFDDHDRRDSTPVAVINDEMARLYFAGEDALGKRVRIRYIDQPIPETPWLTIVGVVGSTRSIRYNHIQWDLFPAVYAAFFQATDEYSHEAFDAQTIFIYVQGRSARDRSVVASAIHDLDSDLPLGSLQTTSEIVNSLRSLPRVRAILLGSLALLTLLLAAIGVGGVTGQLVEQRRREIGIRMALGALASDVLRFVLSSTLRLTLAGMAVGLFVGGVVAHLLRSFLFGVSILDPGTFGVVALLLLVVALCGSYLPAHRATKLDPMVTLRSE